MAAILADERDHEDEYDLYQQNIEFGQIGAVVKGRSTSGKTKASGSSTMASKKTPAAPCVYETAGNKMFEAAKKGQGGKALQIHEAMIKSAQKAFGHGFPANTALCMVLTKTNLELRDQLRCNAKSHEEGLSEAVRVKDAERISELEQAGVELNDTRNELKQMEESAAQLEKNVQQLKRDIEAKDKDMATITRFAEEMTKENDSVREASKNSSHFFSGQAIRINDLETDKNFLLASEYDAQSAVTEANMRVRHAEGKAQIKNSRFERERSRADALAMKSADSISRVHGMLHKMHVLRTRVLDTEDRMNRQVGALTSENNSLTDHVHGILEELAAARDETDAAVRRGNKLAAERNRFRTDAGQMTTVALRETQLRTMSQVAHDSTKAKLEKSDKLLDIERTAHAKTKTQSIQSVKLLGAERIAHVETKQRKDSELRIRKAVSKFVHEKDGQKRVQLEAKVVELAQKNKSTEIELTQERKSHSETRQKRLKLESKAAALQESVQSTGIQLDRTTADLKRKSAESTQHGKDLAVERIARGKADENVKRKDRKLSVVTAVFKFADRGQKRKIDELEETVQDLQDDKSKLERANEELSRDNKKVKLQLDAEVKAHSGTKQDLDATSRSLVECEERCSNQGRLIEELRSKNEDDKKLIDELRGKIKNLESELQESEAARRHHRDSSDKLQSAVFHMMGTQLRQKSSNKELADEIEQMRAMIGTHEESLGMAIRRAQEYRTALSIDQNLLLSANQRLRACEEELSAAREQVQGYRNALCVARSQNASIQHRSDMRGERLAAADEQVQMYKGALATEAKGHALTNERLQESEELLSTANGQLHGYRNALSSARSQNSNIQHRSDLRREKLEAANEKAQTYKGALEVKEKEHTLTSDRLKDAEERIEAASGQAKGYRNALSVAQNQLSAVQHRSGIHRENLETAIDKAQARKGALDAEEEQHAMTRASLEDYRERLTTSNETTETHKQAFRAEEKNHQETKDQLNAVVGQTKGYRNALSVKDNAISTVSNRLGVVRGQRDYAMAKNKSLEVNVNEVHGKNRDLELEIKRLEAEKCNRDEELEKRKRELLEERARNKDPKYLIWKLDMLKAVGVQQDEELKRKKHVLIKSRKLQEVGGVSGTRQRQ